MEHALKTVLTKVFADIADGLKGDALNCRNVAAKEALHEVAFRLECVDFDWIIKGALTSRSADI